MGVFAFLIAYILGGLTALPLLLAVVALVTLWTSVPVGDVDPMKLKKQKLQEEFVENEEKKGGEKDGYKQKLSPLQSKPRKGWLTVRRTFDDGEGGIFDGSYMDIMRSILDSRSKDPKKSRPKDTYFAVLKGSVLFLYEDEAMTEAHAALTMPSHNVEIYPHGLLDGELFTKRNAIKLSALDSSPRPVFPHLMKEMKLGDDTATEEATSPADSNALKEAREMQELARQEAFDFSTPWYIFVRSVAEMEDWYHALAHASAHPNAKSPLEPLEPIFSTEHMQYLVSHLDNQPDPIPMRWFNALIGRIFFSVYKTAALENYIIGRLMKKLAKVKKPSFLADITVTEVSVGETAPSFFKPMLKELTKEGDAAVEVGIHYQGEIRITVQTTATINLGARFKSYEVKLVLAVVLRELEGNLLIKIKPPPSNRIWYAFTKMPRMELSIEPIVSDRQITWGMILKTIEGRLKEIILESVVLPNYDDIAFFDTASLGTRGGIYADAVRNVLKKQDSATMTASAETLPAKMAESVPPLDRNDSMEGLIMPGHFSTTSLPVQATQPGSLETESAVAPVAIPQRAETIAVTPSSSVKTDPSIGTVEPPTPIADTDVTERGRGIEVISPEAGLKAARGGSVPASSRISIEEEADQGLDLHRGTSTTRSSPAPTSRRISHEASQSVEASASQPGNQLNETASIKSLAPSTNSTETKASTNSFFMNLKSRAAAAATAAEASNPKAVAQARETIQKWGVQWAGLKKNIAEAREGRSNSTTSSPASSTFNINNPGSSDNADGNPSISKGFDAMRRVVAERRQREERERVVSDVSRTTPLEVPSDTRNKRRESAGPILFSNLDSSNATSQTNTTEDPARSLLNRRDSISNSAALSDQEDTMLPKYNPPPSAKSVPTVVETLLDASPSRHPGETGNSSDTTALNVPPSASPSPGVKTTPIVSQPTYGAMSMTIPGIHAKNKNEVMAIGFSPPTPPPGPSQGKDEGKIGTKIQGIGNIYKLLRRNSVNNAQTNPEVPAVTPTPTTQLEDSPQSITQEIEVTPTPDNAQPSGGATSLQGSPKQRQGSMDTAPSSPASAALLSLVAKDELARRRSLTRRRTGSLSEYPISRQRSGSGSSSPLSSTFIPSISLPPSETTRSP
ncbi:hypothetical protein CPB86DRAFT_706018 [Serendipita vermifera]|nr:hypothetical protein CPB86DRAFT_706018 [Serendipita vermifera]